LRSFDSHNQLHAGFHELLNGLDLTVRPAHARFSTRVEVEEMFDRSLNVHVSLL
jgi:hypothetical protein